MALEADVLKQLIATFQTELDEKLQIITEGLVALEKNKKGDSKKIIESIFRAAHNIKGSSRSLGITNVGEIAHEIESLFSAFQEKTKKITPDIINLCLLAVDAMDAAMHAYCENKPLSFDLEDLLNRLQQGKPIKSEDFFKITQPLAKEEKKSQLNEYETIRVPLTQVEKVSALLEQLQVNKIAISEHFLNLTKLTTLIKSSRTKNDFSNDQPEELNSILNALQKNMYNNMNELDMITNSLQEEVRMLRLVPVSVLLRQLTRPIRDISQELSKKIECNITGDTVKMDKVVLEGLKDPLIHLLRNAIDHGIESPEERIKKGKPEFGTINIAVIDQGNQIVISIEDDGAGIDYKKIGAAAVKKKIITQAELDAMDEHSILELIFRPEFSTKEIITDISGRGVGLDVVKSNLIDLNGDVTFTTELGKGTTFHLTLPLTLSSDIGLTLRSGGELFIIPISAVEHIMVLGTEDLLEVGATQVILFNQKPIPLNLLSDLLDLQKKDAKIKDKLPIVLLKKGWDKIALLVEEIIGECEIVIKPLNPPLIDVPCVSGGTLSGTGEVIIVLNPGDLINRALIGDKAQKVVFQTDLSDTKPRILLVEDSITTRTLEKNILESNNYEVTAVTDGQEAWNLLQKKGFDLVITDIEMPNMDGFELTDKIKKNEVLQSIPVIIVTSLGTEEHKKQGIEVGADAYIVKHDFESTELLDIVGQLV